MKIIDRRPEILKHRSISVHKIPMGQSFMGCIGADTGLFVRHYSGVTLLENPYHEWAGTAQVLDYQPVEVEVHITRNLP